MNTLSRFFAPRPLNGLIFLFCAAMIGIALYMEFAMNLEPCPLCIMQRIFFIATGLVALVGALHNPARKGVRVYGVISTLTALAGAGFAIRQIYLQHLPKDQVPQCLPSISYMLQADFPLAQVLRVLFSGDGNCAEILWTDPVLHLGIPHWALIGFVMLAGAGLFQVLRKS
jgi:disulfide bond formation protein DsbB